MYSVLHPFQPLCRSRFGSRLRSLGLLALAAACLTTASTAAAQTVSDADYEELKRLFVRARELQSRGELAASSAAFQEILGKLPAAEGGLDPNRARIHFAIAQNSARLDLKPQALEQLALAVKSGYWNEPQLRRDPALAALRGEKRLGEIADEASRGLAAAVLKLATIHGPKLDEKDLASKVLILDVWGTWCPPCRRELPHFKKLQEAYRERGLRVIGLNWENGASDKETMDAVKEVIAKEGLNYPCVLLPGPVHQLIPDLAAYPTTFFVDHEGRVRERLTGYQEYVVLDARVRRYLDLRDAARAAAPEKAPGAQKSAGGS
jgi:thiol-disulfide isomerase/thioredoxin